MSAFIQQMRRDDQGNSQGKRRLSGANLPIILYSFATRTTTTSRLGGSAQYAWDGLPPFPLTPGWGTEGQPIARKESDHESTRYAQSGTLHRRCGGRSGLEHRTLGPADLNSHVNALRGRLQDAQARLALLYRQAVFTP